MEDLKGLERAAKDHKEAPERASPADLCYYWTMRGVYDSLRAKILTKDDARTAKCQAVAAYEQFATVLRNAMEAHKERERAIKVIGSTRAALHSEKTLEGKYRIALHGLSAVSGESITENVEVKWLESNEQENAGAEIQESC